jgi:hypothetical protein
LAKNSEGLAHIIILWQKFRTALFWRLGFALYVLVGLIYMLISTWLPLYVRFPHALEILAGEFVYAGVLTALLTKRAASERLPRGRAVRKAPV